jgi:hypothetical protein
MAITRKYYFNKDTDILYEVGAVNCSYTKKTNTSFCSTMIYIYHKQNPIDSNTHQHTKESSVSLSENYSDSEMEAKSYFDTEIKRRIGTSNEITEDEYNQMKLTYNNAE